MKRRSFLRGAFQGSSVVIGLPLFESMLNCSGTAFADGTELPTRFGIWFWGNGVRPDYWTPLTTGTSWEPNEETEPLRSLRPYLSVASGYDIKTDSHPHHSGMAGIFTGRKYQKIGDVRDTIASTFASQSVDQIAADHFMGQTPFRSLEVGITKFHGTDEGSTFQHLSHNGPNNFNPSTYSATQLFHRLFGLSQEEGKKFARRSVLDVVYKQSNKLSRRLGAADAIRLEQHLESIRTLELQLAYAGNTCESIIEPFDHPEQNGQEQIEAKNNMMSDILALALACDLSRVFSVQFSTAGSAVVFSQAGAVDGLHGLCHTEALPQPTVHAATTMTMEHLAQFLQKLRDTPEGDGNLLTHSSILCTSELTDGYTHGNFDFPLIVAGLGSGRLCGNMHHRSATSESATDVVLTALRGAGVEAESFGADEGYTTQSVSALES